ncbi:MAG: beta-1,6-N-acetylglucosaminyltransferase [Anaerostipes sp.]|uniref:beta-1,6-N-acetylglucosaminyltransferase n=1 Tax=Anaerostipes sp. TaxID=1872530 RepID=UPI0039964F93
MKHAFLIIAYNNWWQLKQLIQMLDDENNDIFVHIDLKSKDFNISDFVDITKKSKIYFYQKYKVYWGGYSIVQTEMFLFETAHKIGYDYYHLLSGSDLPLKTNSEIHDFFEKNKGKQFIQYDEEKLQHDPEIRRRTKYYHYLQNYRRRFRQRWMNELFTFLERISLVVQILLCVNRVKDVEWTVKYGSEWVSITDDFVITLLEQKEKIEKIFSYTNCADELFVQTVAFNCGFQDALYRLQSGKTDNARFIDWERGKNGNPYTFKSDDYDLLESQSAMFARKFSETVDKEIITKISGK